ncbi:MAG TPA: hypothetical protein VD970_13245 [Acetobacteraceae bacterium]|nr:hypothetical protein [Acetobacteraceae bacterium]
MRPGLALRLIAAAALGGAAALVQARGAPAWAAALAITALAAALVPSRPSRAIPILAASLVLPLLLPRLAAVLLALLPAIGMALFAWHFGATLRPGEEPLITRYIREDFSTLPAECVPYGRALTAFWTAAFLVFAALNLLPIFGMLAAEDAAAITLLASGLLFLGEHAVRARRFPHLPVTPGRTLRAMWQAGRVRHAR